MDYIIPMMIILVLAFMLGTTFGALWGLSRHEWLYCRVGARMLQRMREAMRSLGIDEWRIDKAQEYIGAIIPPYTPMPTPPTVSDDLEEAAENYAATGEILPNGKEMISFDEEKAFRAGANWQKKQLMKHAVDGYVKEPYTLVWEIVSDSLSGGFVVENNLRDGDKVKLIVIKDDGQ